MGTSPLGNSFEFYANRTSYQDGSKVHSFQEIKAKYLFLIFLGKEQNKSKQNIKVLFPFPKVDMLFKNIIRKKPRICYYIKGKLKQDIQKNILVNKSVVSANYWMSEWWCDGEYTVTMILLCKGFLKKGSGVRSFLSLRSEEVISW